MTITGIRPIKKGLAQLYIDGEAAVKIDREVLLLSGYTEGAALSDGELHTLIQDSDARRAREKALYLLERRSHSKKELTDKIAAVAPREAAKQAAQRMEEIGLVNDTEFAGQYARDLFYRKKLGLRRVRQELRLKGIDQDLIESTVEELLAQSEENGSVRAAELLNKKYRLWREDEKVRRRAVAALQRMGYSWEEISGAMKLEGEDWNA